MRAAVYRANDDVRVEQLERPEIGRQELLLRVEASGICGSDLMEWYRKPQAPLVLGHEVAGVVEEVGEAVDGFAVADRIVTTHHVPCNACRYCATDRHNACEMLHRTRFDPGGFAELVRLPAANVTHGTFRLPDSVSFEEGSFVEPLACVVRGQRVAGLGPGDTVAVLGAGLSGILHLQLARARAVGSVFVTDLNRSRREMALRFGATAAFDPADDVAARIREANGGRLVERVFVCVASRKAMETALEVVDDGGTVQFFAPLPPGQTLELPVHNLWKRGVTLTHSYAGPPDDMRAALELIADGRVDVASMVTHRLPLDRTQEGFQLALAGGEALKVIVEPQR